MIRGIKFEIPNSYGSYINEILNGIDLKQYKWKVDEDEIYLDDEHSLFPYEVISGVDFKKTISRFSYYIVFAKLQAYSPNSNFCELNDYDDFLKSNCELVIFFIDSIFVDIYSKDKEVINKIKNNAERWKFKGISYITDKNDRMTKFSVWY